MITLIVEKTLQELHIPYTRTYLHGYMEHLPLNDSLWAVKKVFDHYKIDNASYSITDKTSITGINCPFIVQLSEGLVVVNKVSSEYVTFLGTKGKYTKTFVEFMNSWSGVIMICKSTETSSEPNYFKHRRAAIRRNIYRIITAIALGLLIGLGFIKSIDHWEITIELLTSIIGLSLSFLLLKKHLSIPSPTAEKICSIIKHGKCDEHVSIRSNKPLSHNNFDLSEFGVSFFAINTIAILIFSNSIIPSIGFVLTLTFPLSLWSIGWQLINHAWCALCTMVMATLWISLIILAPVIDITLSIHLGIHLIALFCSYWILLQAIHTISEQYIKKNKQKEQINTLQRAKYNKEIWNAILSSSKTIHPISEEMTSSLIFGNKVSNLPLITVVGNPYCKPCARMHRRLQPLIEAGFPIQYIYTYFNPDLAPVNKQIVATYIREGRTQTWEKLTLWYDGDKSRHPFNPDNAQPIESKLESEVVRELHKQNEWIENSEIKATPTVLINGIPLPSNFIVEDLLYLY